MRQTLPEPAAGTHLLRMLYRSAHIYLLLAGLINIALGSYLVASRSTGVRRIQSIGSILILMSPALILTAFIYEVPLQTPDRPLILTAMVSLLAGALLHLLASSWTSNTRS